jgi:ABC-type multidrug transport system fused ATPase/permease subunit
MEEDLKIM